MNQAKSLKIISECMMLIGYAIGMTSIPEAHEDIIKSMNKLNKLLETGVYKIMKEIESA